MRRNPAAFPTPQTTGCALAHRLPSDTTTAAQSIAVLLPPPWGRAGVGAAKKRAATKPHRTSSFTYTFPATLYVKTTIGCALAHRLPSDTTIAASPRPRRSIGVVAEAANAKKQTSAHKQHLHPPPHLSRPSDELFQSPAAGFALQGRGMSQLSTPSSRGQ